jgi:hypothetical protein
MEAAGCTETLINTYQSIRLYVPEEVIFSSSSASCLQEPVIIPNHILTFCVSENSILMLSCITRQAKLTSQGLAT